MVDNEYSRTKMRGFVMGLEAASRMITSADDDPTIFQEQVQERIKACCEEWNIKLPVREDVKES